MLTNTYFCTNDEGTLTIIHRPTGSVFHLYELTNIGGNTTTDMVGIFSIKIEGDFELVDRMVTWFAGANCYKTEELFTIAIEYLNVYFKEETK